MAAPRPWWQRLVQRIAYSRAGIWFFSRTLHHIDLPLLRMTRGRISVPSVLAGLPVITLTTTGAKSGAPRSMPVLGIPDRDRFVLIASSWGRRRHPAWRHNLRAHPEATVARTAGRSRTLRARPLVRNARCIGAAPSSYTQASSHTSARRATGRSPSSSWSPARQTSLQANGAVVYMTVRSVIVAHNEVPDAFYDLVHAAFPDDTYDLRAFWPPDSVHALVYDNDRLVAHAGFLVRTLFVGGRPIEAAYVEYVGAEPRRSGYGTIAVEAIDDEIRRRGFALAGLATGSPEFYERLGWRRWRGPKGYRSPDGAVVPTPDEGVMVLDLGAGVDLDAAIECEWRPVGDIW